MTVDPHMTSADLYAAYFLASRTRSRVLRDLMERAGSLRGQARAVAGHIVARLHRLDDATVESIAEELSVSRSTVLRTIRQLGYATFADLKESVGRLLMEMGRGVSGTTAAALSMHAYFPAAQRALDCLAETFVQAQRQAESFRMAAAMIRNASFVLVHGAAPSGGVGMLLHEKLLNMGLPSAFTGDHEGVVNALPALSERGVVVVVTHVPAGSNVARPLMSASRHNVPSLLITNADRGPAMEYARVVLTTGVAESGLAPHDLAGRAAQLLLLDILAGELAPGPVRRDPVPPPAGRTQVLAR